jgi:spore coat protein CotH
MKKLFILMTIVIVIFLGFWFKTYNPTAPGIQTETITYLVKLTDILFLPYYFKTHQLPVYNITIKPEDYAFLNQNLPNPSQGRFLFPEYKQYVPAKFIFNDQEYKVEVHYRGGDFDHWQNPKKSWRIKFKKSKIFQGQRTINLIIPEDRGMYIEELSNFRAKKLGLIVPDSQFAVLKVNGQTQGIYWQVEHWTQTFLEKNQLPIGNLYGENDEVLYHLEDRPLFESVQYWDKHIQANNSKSDDYTEIAVLLDLLNNASDQDFYQKLPLIFDIDNLLTWQAHSVLMGSDHQDSSHNIRLYWHPDFGKFIIFPWDVAGILHWPIDYNPLVSRVLKNPDWLKKRNQILTDYVSNSDNLKQDLEYYDQLISLTKIAVFQDELKFFSDIGYLKQVKKTRQMLIDQFELVKNSLNNNSIPDETSAFDLPKKD